MVGKAERFRIAFPSLVLRFKVGYVTYCTSSTLVR